MTLIDKAEAHDNDLIRRGDALAAAKGFIGAETAIAALPARGVGPQMCGKCMGSGYGGHPDSGVPCADCKGSGAILAPTDAAQVREAALREAAKVGADAAFNYWAETEKPVSQRKYGGAGLPASVSLAILALIGEART